MRDHGPTMDNEGQTFVTRASESPPQASGFPFSGE